MKAITEPESARIVEIWTGVFGVYPSEPQNLTAVASLFSPAIIEQSVQGYGIGVDIARVAMCDQRQVHVLYSQCSEAVRGIVHGVVHFTFDHQYDGIR